MIHYSAISKITLGTVQMGTIYGIANKHGQPGIEDSHSLLKYALDNGIQSIDTARIYGNAEEVVGSFDRSNTFTVISKFKLSDAALDNAKLAIIEAKESAVLSAEKLNRINIPIYLFHKNKDQDIKKVNKILPLVLKELKETGLIGEGGISVYTPEELQHIDDCKEITAAQVPMNLLDTRLLRNNLMQTLINNNVKVFIRSVFLQGLLLMKEEDLPVHLLHAGKYLNLIKTIAKSANKDITDLAFSFVRDTPGVSSIVVGVDTIEQLQKNIQLISTPPLSNAIVYMIRDSFENIPETIITPALWGK